jgi:hypothetical protein
VGGSQALRLLSRADFLDAAAAERLGLADAIAEAVLARIAGAAK